MGGDLTVKEVQEVKDEKVREIGRQYDTAGMI